MFARATIGSAALFLLLALAGSPAFAAVGEKPRDIEYEETPPAPRSQSPEAAAAKSFGCLTCHEQTDQPTMHANPGVVLGCVDCHGGDPEVEKPVGLVYEDQAYKDRMDRPSMA